IQLSISGTKVTENNHPFLKVAQTGQLFRLAGEDIGSYADGSELTISGTLQHWQAASPLLEATKIKRTNLH
ncbi:MAG: hypothetical protein ACRECJ_05200, partial [Limisphaerales bacterium]